MDGLFAESDGEMPHPTGTIFDADALFWTLESFGSETMGIARCLLSCLAFFAILLTAVQAQDAQPKKPSTPKQKKSQKKPTGETYTLVGAGDIAACNDLRGARATAALIEAIPGTVFAAGDLAYNQGTISEFRSCYDPTWGKFKDRTRPSPGNHEYNGSDAIGYFQYWDGRAGDPAKGYYSYDLGAWHVVVLNTNCDVSTLGGCDVGSPEEKWLREDLAAHPSSCIVAYGHHALFSSGILSKHSRHKELRPFWQALYEAHADVILAGHEHSYERFAPQDPQGKLDPQRGIRQFTVGTGGRSHTLLGFAQPNSELRNDDTFGVLKLTLSPGKYKWEFVPEAGRSFHDSGEGTCHNVSPIAK